MLSNEDNNGLLTFMAGIVVVVFFGVGLSIVIDRRLSFSNSALSLEKSIEKGREEIEELEHLHKDSSHRLMILEEKVRDSVSGLESLRQGDDLESRVMTLDSTRSNLRSDIGNLEKEFSLYREKFREALWNSATNQSLGTLTTRSGREYKNAFIVRVTEIGLDIRHENGSARIKASDIEQSLQERFQWNEQDH